MDPAAASTKPYSPVLMPEPTRMAPVPGASTPLTTDLCQLLHKRLWFLSWLFAAGTAFLAGFPLVHILIGRASLLAESWGDLAIYFGLFALAAALTAILWRRSLTLRQLRAAELAMFGALFAFWSWTHGCLYLN